MEDHQTVADRRVMMVLHVRQMDLCHRQGKSRIDPNRQMVAGKVRPAEEAMARQTEMVMEWTEEVVRMDNRRRDEPSKMETQVTVRLTANRIRATRTARATRTMKSPNRSNMMK